MAKMTSPGPTAPRAEDIASRTGVLNETLVQDLLEGRVDFSVIEKMDDQDRVVGQLLDMALASLKRSDAMMGEMVTESAAFRKASSVDLAALKASQRETRILIEELVNGG